MTSMQSMRRVAHLAVLPLLVLTMSLIPVPVFSATKSQSQAQIDKAYSDYLAKHRSQKITFGNNVDVKGKMLDLAKTFVDKVGIDNKKWDAVRSQLMANIEYAEANGKLDGLSGGDVMRFVAKSALPFAKQQALDKLNLSDESKKWLLENAANIADVGAQTTGTAAGDGPWRDIGEQLATGAIDTLCPQCAIARKAVLVAIEGGKWAEAWLQDDILARDFANWENDPNGITPGILAGHSEIYSSARAALERAGIQNPTTAQIDAFIAENFDRWKAEKAKKSAEADIMAKVQKSFVDLSRLDRGTFGDKLDAQAEGYARGVLEIYNDLMKYGAKGCSNGGPSDLLSSATYLVKQRNRPLVEYRALFKKELRAWGCIDEIAEMDEDTEQLKRQHIFDRFKALDEKKLEAVLDHMGVRPPKSFFECLCRQAGYHSSGAKSVYSPEQYLEPFDKRYSCHQPGPPCIVAGNGCTRHPLIRPVSRKVKDKDGNLVDENPIIWDSCMNENLMPNGERFDTVLLDLFQQGR